MWQKMVFSWRAVVRVCGGRWDILHTWDQRVDPDSASTSPDERVATKAVRTLMVLAAGKMTWE
jgi:hypothetical protein